MSKPFILCILDGFGINDDSNNNAINKANTEFIDYLTNKYLFSKIHTSGKDIGLPEGQMGNSEVGHMAIGSGRIILQDLPKIDNAIHSGDLKNHYNIQQLINSVNNHNTSCHLLGLISDGGVHSSYDHLIYIVNLLNSRNIKVKIHGFLDGRDTPPKSAVKYLYKLEQAIKNMAYVSIASLSGRFYAMDRDQRWERTTKAYNAIVMAKGKKVNNFTTEIEFNYQNNIYDEFIEPLVAADYQGIKDNDAILMTNFRADRARQILDALLVDDFNGFKREHIASLSYALGMTEYSNKLNNFIHTIFPPEYIANTLPEILAANGYTQLRIAETEKYAHVTFFFNGGKEHILTGEKRILVPSPNVRTYNLKPEMSAYEITNNLIEVIKSSKLDFIVVNYANSDMVGHTGDMQATIKAIEILDQCVEKLYMMIKEYGGSLLIVADHGNAELMVNPKTGEAHTSHTTNPVPCILVDDNFSKDSYYLTDGNLADIAPTILEVMGVKKPKEMTGKSLINKIN